MTASAAASSSPGIRLDALTIFHARCEARAKLWQCGELSLHEAVDGLQAAAVRDGLVTALGQDEVQRIIASAFHREHGPNWEDEGWEQAAREYHSQRGNRTTIVGTPGTNPQADKPPEPKPTIHWQYHDEKPSPPTPWLIKKLLPRTGAGLISGQWGTFKTTVALDMSVSVMAEPPFAGHFVVKRRGGVAYFAPEGAGGLKSRLDAIAKERGVTGALPFAWCAGCPPLMAPDALEQLARMAKEAARYLKQHFGVDLVLIFIDTIIAAAGYAKTGDDNDAAAGQKVMKVLSDLSARTEVLVLGIDHFGKIIDTGTRGSSAKEGHADVVLALVGDRQLNGTITNTRLALRKLRDGPSGLEIPFTPRDIEIGLDEDKQPETRKVIDWNKATTSAKPDDDTGWSKSLQLLRRILMTLLADGKDITPFADGPMVRAVDLKLIRAEFYKQYPADGTDEQKTEARRKAFARAIKDAQAKLLIVIREIEGVQLVWFAQREAAI